MWVLGIKPGPLVQQPMHLTAEPSVQPQQWYPLSVSDINLSNRKQVPFVCFNRKAIHHSQVDVYIISWLVWSQEKMSLHVLQSSYLLHISSVTKVSVNTSVQQERKNVIRCFVGKTCLLESTVWRPFIRKKPQQITGRGWGPVKGPREVKGDNHSADITTCNRTHRSVLNLGSSQQC